MFHKILVIAFALVIATVLTYANIARAQAVKEGLVGYWPFDKDTIKGDTVKDVFGKNDGTIIGDPKNVTGKIGEALEFGGDGDYVNLDGDITFSKGDWTILLWFNSKDISKFVHFTGVSAQDVGGWSPLAHFGIYNYKLAWWDSSGKWRFGDTELSGDKWYFTGLSNSKGDLTLWLDADEDFSSQCKDNPIARVGAFGLRQHGNDRYFYGTIDEIHLYDRTLSKAEIKKNLEATAVNPCGKLSITWGEIKASK